MNRLFEIKNIRVIFLIILLAFILRFYQLDRVPAGIYVDEAAHGYNAYSLLTTGKDEYGKQFPILMRSFGTYSSPLYDYLTIIPVKLIGLNEISVRLISAISGIVIVVIVLRQFGALTGLVVATAPIFILTSRAAYEPNLGLVLLLLGSVLAFKAGRHPRLLLLAFPILSLSAYGYHAERLVATAVIVFFSLKYLSKKVIFLLLASLFLALIIQIPFLSVSSTQGASARLSGLGVEGTLYQKIFSFIRLYLAYLSPSNLFNKPDPDPQRSFTDLSAFYWWMVIPFVFGIYSFIKDKLWANINGQYFIVLLLVSPILGSLTRDYFSTLRALPLFIVIAWLIALGLRIMVKYKYVYIVLLLISILELYSNLVLLKHEKSSIWNYEYKSLFQALSAYRDKNIVIDNTRSKPVYILEAFYNKTSSSILQSRFNHDQLADYYSQIYYENNLRIGNIEYRPINWKDDSYKEQILVSDLLGISDDQMKEHKLKLLNEIYDINNQVVLKVFANDPKKKCEDSNTQPLEIYEKCQKILTN